MFYLRTCSSSRIIGKDLRIRGRDEGTILGDSTRGRYRNQRSPLLPISLRNSHHCPEKMSIMPMRVTVWDRLWFHARDISSQNVLDLSVFLPRFLHAPVAHFQSRDT